MVVQHVSKDSEILGSSNRSTIIGSSVIPIDPSSSQIWGSRGRHRATRTGVDPPDTES
ncbi:MAG: hypothetical protein KJO69_05870 [Gammaproteobacteria bacterium]|nr:hypothetical protein [Gammaproteobacteria bacterium]